MSFTKIFLNPSVYSGIIQIDNQKIIINKELAEMVGYAHSQANVSDLTGDGKEEIILVISGGASGAVQAVQVFEEIDGMWKEIVIPSDVYSDMPRFLKKKFN